MGQEVHSLEGCSGVSSAKGDNSKGPCPVEKLPAHQLISVQCFLGVNE